MGRIAEICLSMTKEDMRGASRDSKRKELRKGSPGPESPCAGFLMERKVRRLGGKEVELEAGLSLDPNRAGLPSPELPILVEHSYSFGLFSVRLAVNVFLRKDMSMDHLISGWRILSQAFRRYMDGMLSDIPGSRLSNFYSEVYVLEGSLADVRKGDAEKLISPLKEFPLPSKLLKFRDITLVSKDGFLTQLMKPGRVYRDTRRKMRRVLRIAADIVLGQKVFYTNPSLWREEDNSWAAFVGLVYLNPDLWTSKVLYPSRRMYSAYKRLSMPFSPEIRKGFEAYSSIHGEFLSGVKIRDLHRVLLTMSGLGLRIPPLRVPLLTDLEALVLTMLCMKDALDSDYKNSKAYTKIVSRKLCSEFNPGEECEKSLSKKIRDRKNKRGLSVEEIEVLLGGRFANPRGILSRREVMENLMRKGLVRVELVKRGGSGYPEVNTYIPEVDSDYVGWLKSLISKKIPRRLP